MWQVQQYIVAGLHDHMMNWKVDLDVTGINNTFVISVRSLCPPLRPARCWAALWAMSSAADHAWL